MAETTLHTDVDKFEQFLKKHPFTGVPENLYEPMNYMMNLGGKRMRPKLLLMAYEAVNGHLNNDAFKLALAIETFHNFSLVHDDIMDNAPIRRGKPTVHLHWNAATAILAGDNLIMKCYELILDTNLENTHTILKLFTAMAQQVCEGQQMDMNLPQQSIVTEADYLEMIKLKTAVLPALALKIGALAANAPLHIAEEYYAFGLNFGMAFQLQDDYLDSFGTAADIGKQEGGDILENKKTILYLHALQTLPLTQQTELNNWYNNTTQSQEKIEQVRSLFSQANSHTYLTELKHNYEQKALAHLQIACKNNNYLKAFMGLFEVFRNRKG